MKAWRICKAKWETAAFTGRGSEKAGGRWNPKGLPMVYASEHLSLAALEVFVHVDPEDMPDDLVSVCIELPDTVSTERIDVADLPKNWRNTPAPPALKDLGQKWLTSQASLALVVPSAIVPVECNILLNPLHPEMKSLTPTSGEPFHFDPRMFKTGK